MGAAEAVSLRPRKVRRRARGAGTGPGPAGSKLREIDAALAAGAVLLDVRTDEELAEHGTIDGFIHIPIDELERGSVNSRPEFPSSLLDRVAEEPRVPRSCYKQTDTKSSVSVA